MKIVSDFKDYYDGIQIYGFDDSSVWIRKSKTELLSCHYTNILTDSELFKSSQQLFRDISYVGFCGKIYPMFKKCWIEVLKGNITRYSYSADQIVKVLDEYDISKKSSKEFCAAHKKKNEFARFGYHINKTSAYDKADEFFGKFSGTTNLLEELFIECKTPIFLIENIYDKGYGYKFKITINPNLSELNFQTVKDPYTAFQDIDMFTCIIARNNDENMIIIEDKYKISAHGFDKMSFRKYPTKHRK